MLSMGPFRRKKFMFLYGIILTCALIPYMMHSWLAEQVSSRPGYTNIKILLWHWPFKKSDRLEEDVCGRVYGVSGCQLLDNRRMFHEADVVVFHHSELMYGTSKLPLNLSRPSTQKWVWMSLESPANTGDLHAYNGLFNWTMTYRRDADIFVPYGTLVPRAKESDYVIPQKDVLACWVVSNYQEYHVRTKLYMKLKERIPLQVYGQWMKKPLKPSELLPVISRCWFYLAFENSVSRDYITEKLWRNSFQAGTLPIVLGPPRANYQILVPPDSFIHVDDFNSTEELAMFLTKLASDEEQYRSHFCWRRHFDIKLYSNWKERLCMICSQYKHLPQSKVYHDLHAWVNQDLSVEMHLRHQMKITHHCNITHNNTAT